MVTRIVLAGLVVVALMVGVKDGRILRVAGLTGSCTVVQTIADGTQLEACKAGKLEGMPDLSRQRLHGRRDRRSAGCTGGARHRSIP